MANYGAIQLPQITENQLDSQKERRQILNYLALLDEKLRYMFQNIDIEENLSADAQGLFFQYGKDIQNIIQDTEGNFSLFQQKLDGITMMVADNEGNIALLQQTAKSLTSSISDAEGNISQLQQTASQIQSTVRSVQGDISTLEQTASKIQSTVRALDDDLGDVSSTATQTAKEMSWIIKSGTSSSNMKLTTDFIELMSEKIEITGYVTFNDLERSGKTEINGDNITTGTIDAANVTLGTSRGGFCVARGNDGSSTTAGAKMYGSDEDNYFIATGSGVRMTYNDTYAVYCTRNGVTLLGDYEFRAATNFFCRDDGSCLGTRSYLWDTVYAETGEINTSDRRKKNGISYDMTPYEALFARLKPTPYRLENGKSGRTHLGYIAQDIEESMEEIGMKSTDFAGFIKSPIYEREKENGEEDKESPILDYDYALRYSEFTALHTHMIQRLLERVEELERRVAELEGR